MAEVNVQIWQDFLVKKLFKDNAFLNYFAKADRYVKEGKYVIKPQSGEKPETIKNPANYPLVAVNRVDGAIMYEINQFSTRPLHITNAEKYELSYDKMADALADHADTLMETIADEFLYDLVRVYADMPSPITLLRTTGGTGATAVASHLGTGNRLKFVKEDLKRARATMNKQNISKLNRYAMIPSDLYEQLTDDPDLLRRDSSLELDMRAGVVSRLYGFELMERSATVRHDNTATPVAKVPGSADANTDQDTVICWQQNAAERALGAVEFFENRADALYQGDVYSALVRFGGRPSRRDAKGIVKIVQANA